MPSLINRLQFTKVFRDIISTGSDNLVKCANLVAGEIVKVEVLRGHGHGCESLYCVFTATLNSVEEFSGRISVRFAEVLNCGGNLSKGTVRPSEMHDICSAFCGSADVSYNTILCFV